MVLSNALWKGLRCAMCGAQAEHALEFTGLEPPIIIVPFCDEHYEALRRMPAWRELNVVEAELLEPRGVG